MARLDTTPPARPLRMSYRNVTGKVALGSGGAASYESTLERDWLLVLDFDPTVRSLHVQPFTLTYVHEGETRRYTPDVKVHFDDDSVVVYEVKPRETLRAEWSKFRARFRAAMRHCRQQGWRFRIVTEREIRTPFLRNATFLRRYRNLPPDPVIEEVLMRSLTALGETTPQELLACAYWTPESRALAIPYLWKFVATHRIGTCLISPLTMSSLIWAAVE